MALAHFAGMAADRLGSVTLRPSLPSWAWITTAKACTAPAVATFAAGSDGDAAVRSALTEPWSGGQAEGRIDRLIKRQSYGRVGLDRLQRRSVLAA